MDEAATGQAGKSRALPLSRPSIPTGAEEVSLEIPANTLESSQRAHITVMGKGQAEGAWGPWGTGWVQRSPGSAGRGTGGRGTAGDVSPWHR